MQNATAIDVLHRDDLPLGGFAGLREHRLVQDSRAWGHHRSPGAWDGLGSFVYLADARFVPLGDTGMHPHHEIDVISIMVDGRITHGGSLEDGEHIVAPAVQVQRAGGEGFRHNEVNPDDSENRMLQLWVLPETPGQAAGYQVHHPQPGAMTRIYGNPGQNTFESHTTIDVGLLKDSQSVEFEGPYIAYLSRGRGEANGIAVADGDLLRGEDLSFKALGEVQLTVVQTIA